MSSSANAAARPSVSHADEESRPVCIIDASALLAFLQDEPGSRAVAGVLSGALISSVNVAEVLQKCTARNIPFEGLLADLAALGVRTIAFTNDHAERTARMRPLTKAAALSLADRACLALAQAEGLPVYTADKDWKALGKVLGVDIRVIR